MSESVALPNYRDGYINGYSNGQRDCKPELDGFRAELAQAREALKVADDSIRHHLRGDQISAAMIQPHAVKAIRDAVLAKAEGKE